MYVCHSVWSGATVTLYTYNEYVEEVREGKKERKKERANEHTFRPRLQLNSADEDSVFLQKVFRIYRFTRCRHAENQTVNLCLCGKPEILYNQSPKCPFTEDAAADNIIPLPLHIRACA